MHTHPTQILNILVVPPLPPPQGARDSWLTDGKGACSLSYIVWLLEQTT